MARTSVVVVGSTNTDMIIKVARIPKPGETIIGGEFATVPGGKGANQAVGAARAGGKVTFVTRVGQDMFGDKAIAGFKADGLNVDYVGRDRTSPTGVALIFVAQDGENSIAVAAGANARLTAADVRKAKRAFREAGVVLLQLETPLDAAQAAAELGAIAGARVILNPAPAQRLPDSLLRKLYLLTPNESEAELLTGVAVSDAHSAAKAAEALRARGVKNVIVTMGARGALVVGENLQQMIPSFKVKAVDTTAAGDIFNGCLAVALAEGRTLLEAARFASAAAAISVTKLGAQTSAPMRKEIEKLLTSGNGAGGVIWQKRRAGRAHTQAVSPATA